MLMFVSKMVQDSGVTSQGSIVPISLADDGQHFMVFLETTNIQIFDLVCL